MVSKGLKIASVVLLIGGLPALSGCAACKANTRTVAYSSSCKGACKTACPTGRCGTATLHAETTTKVQAFSGSDLPPNAKPGECYAKVFYPPKFETVSERILTQEASEQLEVIPAKFEWQEKQIMVKAAETRLEPVPAQYEWRDQTIMVDAGHTSWERELGPCTTDNRQTVKDVFCLVNHPPVYKTVKTQCMVSPPTVREVTVPAEFTTIREQVCVTPAQTRRIPIPAREETIEKVVKVADGGIRWELVICERNVSIDKKNSIKEALVSKGFTPGPPNGELGDQDWAALKDYQTKNGLGVGALTRETLASLGVSPD